MVLASEVEAGSSATHQPDGSFADFFTGLRLDQAIGDDFLSAVRGDPCTTGRPVAEFTEIAGWPALWVETEIADDSEPLLWGACMFFDPGLSTAIHLPGGLDLSPTRLIEVDVDGTRLVIQFVAPSKGRLEVLVEKADRMFDTMTIGG